MDEIIIIIIKKIKNKKIKKLKVKTRTKFKETEGLHSGRRSWAPTSIA